MKRRLAAALLLVGVLVHAVAQEEFDLGESTRQAAKALAEARKAYDAADFSQTVLLLNRLLERFGPAPAATLPVEEETVRVEALRLRGISYYNLGQVDAARGDFESLLRLDPDYQLDAKLISPKIVAAFEEARQNVTGIMTVRSDPPGADVRLGNRLLGATPLEALRVVSGRYVLRLEKAGFAQVEKVVEVSGGESTAVEVALERNARNVSVITVPVSATVFVDGKEIGQTSGTPPPGFEALLLDRGLDPGQASAPLTIPYLKAGKHSIRVEKECYAPFEADFSVDLENPELPLELEPVALVESVASARFESEPGGASVYVDGQMRGKTPIELRRLCAGVVDVRMEKEGVGRWGQRVELQAGSESVITGRLRLTLASVGVVAAADVDRDTAAEWEEFLLEVTATQDAYNASPVVSRDREMSSARLEMSQRILSDPRRAPALTESLRKALAQEFGADLLLVAVPGEAGAQLLLYGQHQGAPDRVQVSAATPAVRDVVGSRLSARTRLEATWSGVMAVETARTDFPFVVSDRNAGAGTTVKPGDRIRSVAGTPIVSRRDLERAFENRPVGATVSATVERAGAESQETIEVVSTPTLPRDVQSEFLVNKYLADLIVMAASTSDEREKDLAFLGIGVGYLATGNAEQAVKEGFAKARLESGPGVSAGTVSFLTGVALETLGPARAQDARKAFEDAAAASEATLWRNDGPLVAPLAASRLRRY